MASRLSDGSILMKDGRVVYANSVLLAADLLEILPLVTPTPAWPFVSGGGGGAPGPAGPRGVAGSDGAPGSQGAQGPSGGGGLSDVGVWMRAVNALILNNGDDQPMTWDTVVKDNTGFWNPLTPTLVTVPAGLGGVYLISVFCLLAPGFASFAADKAYLCRLTKSTSVVQGPLWYPCSQVGGYAYQQTIMESLVPGDTISTLFFNNTGAQRIIGGDATLRLQRLIAA